MTEYILAIEDAGPATVWRPDTPEESADRSGITEAAYAWQMESIARRDEND